MKSHKLVHTLLWVNSHPPDHAENLRSPEFDFRGRWLLCELSLILSGHHSHSLTISQWCYITTQKHLKWPVADQQASLVTKSSPENHHLCWFWHVRVRGSTFRRWIFSALMSWCLCSLAVALSWSSSENGCTNKSLRPQRLYKIGLGLQSPFLRI